MKDEEQEIEVVSQDSLTPYLEAEARKRTNSKNGQKCEDVSRDEADGDSETEAGPLSGEELRIAISQPPASPELQKIKKAANVLKFKQCLAGPFRV